MTNKVSLKITRKKRSKDKNNRIFPFDKIEKEMKDCFGDKKCTKISKESKRLIQLCLKDFIILITSEGKITLKIASEQCMMQNRKTMTGNDLFNSLKVMGFGGYIDTL